jgi:hypothetical protein
MRRIQMHAESRVVPQDAGFRLRRGSQTSARERSSPPQRRGKVTHAPPRTQTNKGISITSRFVQGGDHRAAVKAQEKLRDQLAPRYQWLFTHMGRLEGGVKFLVDLRTNVLVRFVLSLRPLEI